jgi:glycosyltransferase involved in cell wall biosynthesis
LPQLIFTVTNDLNYDQRMQRICGSLQRAGFTVVLVGRKKKDSKPLSPQVYQQKRLPCFFEKGFLFYAEYNIRLFFFLMFAKADGLCAIDLDTIIPVYLISKLRGKKRIYDAHELFCEMKEIVTRPRIYSIWKWIEKNTVPKFKLGYTVNEPISAEFGKMYGVHYEIIRSISLYQPLNENLKREDFILYQGAVNEGRCFETLIPAMKQVNAQLVVCGDGNFMQQAKELVQQYDLEKKVLFKGMIDPAALKIYTAKARIGITLFEKDSRSNYFSLANRFFDYIHAGTPQLCVNYPAYREINNLHPVAVVINNTGEQEIATALNNLLTNEMQWQQMHEACLQAAKLLNWQEEEKKLIAFYKKIFV